MRRIEDPVRFVDIGLRLGVTPQAVVNWSRRDLGFPPPAARIGDAGTRETLVWEWRDVERWHNARTSAQ
jgi:hypothetical protein